MCKDPRGTENGRFEENGKYIGHDEPSMRFVSNQPGSGNDVTYPYFTTLGAFASAVPPNPNCGHVR